MNRTVGYLDLMLSGSNMSTRSQTLMYGIEVAYIGVSPMLATFVGARFVDKPYCTASPSVPSSEWPFKLTRTI